jgi:hypothetical protein
MLFLWSPAPLLTDALNIMTAWGFEYATCAVWVKDRFGMGVRQQHELLLIGKRGLGIVLDPSKLSSSIIEAARGAHSRKPDEAYEMIEAMYPSLPKIELFARHARAGWAAWGNEVENSSGRWHSYFSAAQAQRRHLKVFHRRRNGPTGMLLLCPVLGELTSVSSDIYVKALIPHGSPSGPHGFRPVGFYFERQRWFLFLFISTASISITRYSNSRTRE